MSTTYENASLNPEISKSDCSDFVKLESESPRTTEVADSPLNTELVSSMVNPIVAEPDDDKISFATDSADVIEIDLAPESAPTAFDSTVSFAADSADVIEIDLASESVPAGIEAVLDEDFTDDESDCSDNEFGTTSCCSTAHQRLRVLIGYSHQSIKKASQSVRGARRKKGGSVEVDSDDDGL